VKWVVCKSGLFLGYERNRHPTNLGNIRVKGEMTICSIPASSILMGRNTARAKLVALAVFLYLSLYYLPIVNESQTLQ
jgi:hypothetical protein